MYKILIVDDEIDIRELLRDILQDEGYDIKMASTASGALEAFNAEDFDLILLDIWLEGSAMDGMGVLKAIKAKIPGLPVIMISGHGNIETAVKAIKNGAYDFIEKPFKVEKLLIMVQRAIAAYKMLNENSQLRQQIFEGFELGGNSKAAQGIAKQVQSAIHSNSRVLLLGEHGTGKEFIARSIHMGSNRAHHNFGVLRTDGLDEKSCVAQLYGDESAPSILQMCTGGTIYIDEVIGLSPEVQGVILKMLQDTKLDVRVIASSIHEPLQAIERGELNSSLYYRINVLQISVTPLRGRKEDVEFLAYKFIEHFAKILGLHKIIFSTDAILFMQTYSWPGNVRQLKNIIEWLMIMKSKDQKPITAADFPAEMYYSAEKSVQSNEAEGYEWMSNAFDMPLREAKDEFEKHYLHAQLQRYRGNISKTAKHLGIDRTVLHRKLKALGLSKE
jgi:two-component system nitrogen regulation response regulator NtrX